MKVLWLKDSKAGHRNKALGLLRAFRQLTDVNLIECDLEWRWSGLRQLLSRLGGGGLNLPVRWFVRGLPDLSGVDLILSAGGATQWPNAALAHQCNAKNVFLGSIRKMPPEAFDLIASHDPISDELPFFRFKLIPSIVTPEHARIAASQTVDRVSEDWGLLIGGDGEGISWSTADYIQLTETFLRQARQAGVRVWVATSRRTPVEIEAQVRTLVEQSGLLRKACWFHFREADSPPLLVMFGACNNLLVGADSMSMTHEAISSGARVISASPVDSRANSRSLNNLLRLEELGFLKRQSLDGISILTAMPTGGWKRFEGDPSLPLAEAVLHVLGRAT
jgi:mitochondrial fission protein ELM1